MQYPTAEFRDNESSFLDYYDEIEVFEQAAAAHYKSAFQIRNRELEKQKQEEENSQIVQAVRSLKLMYFFPDFCTYRKV